MSTTLMAAPIRTLMCLHNKSLTRTRANSSAAKTNQLYSVPEAKVSAAPLEQTTKIASTPKPAGNCTIAAWRPATLHHVRYWGKSRGVSQFACQQFTEAGILGELITTSLSENI